MSLRQIKITSFILLCLVGVTSKSNAQKTYDEKEIVIALRMIGHQVLINSDDSTSRVLPITRKNNQYTVSFDTEFAFHPDELVTTIQQIVKQTDMANEYIVEVEECDTGAIVYSYKIDDLKESEIDYCYTRDYPKSCYRLLFTLIEVKGVKVTFDTFSNEALASTSQMNYIIIPIFLLIITALFFFGKKRINHPSLTRI